MGGLAWKEPTFITVNDDDINKDNSSIILLQACHHSHALTLLISLPLQTGLRPIMSLRKQRSRRACS